jgi:hypothetical protein
MDKTQRQYTKGSLMGIQRQNNGFQGLVRGREWRALVQWHRVSILKDEE